MIEKRSMSKPIMFFSLRKGQPMVFDERPQSRLGSEPRKEKDVQKEKENKHNQKG